MDRQNLSISYVQLGDVYLMLLNNPAEARRLYAESLRLREQAAKPDPQSGYAQGQSADAHYRLATACLRLGETVAAEEYFGECLTRRRTLAAQDPDDPSLQLSLLLALARCRQHREAIDT